MYNYNKGDYCKMKTYMNKDWDNILHNKTVQEATDELEKIYNQAVNECIPKHNLSSVRKKPIWMSNEAHRKAKRKISK